MPSNPFPYAESVLQAIWAERYWRREALLASNGELVRIIHPGYLNTVDGPDFLNAKIEIGGLVFHGAVELHIHHNKWYSHGHHTDANYNNVVLHVVAEQRTPGSVRNSSGINVPTINLLQVLPQNLSAFIRQLSNQAVLPCKAGFNYVSAQALMVQIEQAHKEYLEKKVHDFFEFYDVSLAPSLAWKHALILALFDGFGIARNRQSMQIIGRQYLRQYTAGSVVERAEFIRKIEQEVEMGNLSWIKKGQRPGSSLHKRLAQAIAMAEIILETPFDQFLGEDYETFWKKALVEAGIGGNLIKILFGTVYLPAIFALSSLFAINTLKHSIIERWKRLSSPIPELLVKPLRELSPHSPKLFENKLGAVHQLRAYCRQRRCNECEVLKKAISS